MKTKMLILRSAFFILLVQSASSRALAQNQWLDTIPQQQVGCVTGQSKIETVDFGESLRSNAKSAGATEIGFPFLTKTDPTGSADGSVNWQACAIYKGPAQSTNGFQQQAIPASAGAYNLCVGTDAKACSDALIAWIRTKAPDFKVPTRVIPLFGYSPDRFDQTKQSVNALMMQTFPLKGDDTASKVPDPATELDKQLYGASAQPRQPRALLTSQFPPLPDITKKGGEQSYSGVLVFVPVTDAEKAALGTP